MWGDVPCTALFQQAFHELKWPHLSNCTGGAGSQEELRWVTAQRGHGPTVEFNAVQTEPEGMMEQFRTSSRQKLLLLDRALNKALILIQYL